MFSARNDCVDQPVGFPRSAYALESGQLMLSGTQNQPKTVVGDGLG
jgi:hypothetical protein